MKKYLYFLLQLTLLSSLNTIVAQSPQKISYQATLRNNVGNLIISNPVAIRISILSGSTNGTPVYVETHSTETNQNGLISIEIGNGVVTTGVFSNINWGANSYFIKTEVDPSGGTSYSISGTTQMLSVPYALYAENTKNSGKTTIILSGDITNAEAAALIAAQAGPNTEVIKIFDTTNVTSLDLSQITSLISLNVANNSALTSINLPNLKSVYEEILVGFNTNLNSFNAPLLETTPNIIFNNNALNTITFPAFKKTSDMLSASGTISFNEDNLTSISFPQAIQLNNFSANNCPKLNSLNLNSLKFCGTISIQDNPKLGNIQLPNLEDATLFIAKNSLLTNINTSNLIKSDDIYINENPLVESLNLNSLKDCNRLKIGNSNLSNLTITNLNNCPQLDFSGNKFSSMQVNSFLNKLTSVTPLNSKMITLNNQNPPAPPTGQGLIDKATLINNGNTVITD
jgi:hypothetical protein